MATTTTAAITDDFNRADSPTLGAGWGPRVGPPSNGINVGIVTNQAEFFTNTGLPVLQEDNRAPVLQPTYPDVTMTAVVTEMTRTGTGLYLIAIGLAARVRERYKADLVNPAFDCNTVELYKTNLFGPDLYVLTLNKLGAYYGPGGDVTVLNNANTVIANVTLPGTVTYTVSGSSLSASFTHGGIGGPLNVAYSTPGGVFPDGGVNFGFAADMRDPAGSARLRVDSVSVTQAVPTVVPDVMSTKLQARYPGVETNLGALIQRYKQDQAVTRWEDYVAHVAAASPETNVGDDQRAFWNTFVP